MISYKTPQRRFFILLLKEDMLLLHRNKRLRRNFFARLCFCFSIIRLLHWPRKIKRESLVLPPLIMPVYELTMVMRALPRETLVTAIARSAAKILDEGGVIRSMESLGETSSFITTKYIT